MYLAVERRIFKLSNDLYSFLLQVRKMIDIDARIRHFLNIDNVLCVVTESRKEAIRLIHTPWRNSELGEYYEFPAAEVSFLCRVVNQNESLSEIASISFNLCKKDSSVEAEIVYLGASEFNVVYVDASELSKVDLRVSANSFEEETIRRFRMLRDKFFGGQ